jgi:hypothetical protein
MVKKIYENTIAQIQAERQRNAEIAKQRAIQEQVNPFNSDIDTSLRVALEKLQKDLNEKIQKLQVEFTNTKQNMIDAAAQRKADYAESVINAAVAIVNEEADKAISHLQHYINKQGG